MKEQKLCCVLDPLPIKCCRCGLQLCETCRDLMYLGAETKDICSKVPMLSQTGQHVWVKIKEVANGK